MSKYCTIHSKGAHTTTECRTLRSQRDHKAKTDPSKGKIITAAKFGKKINTIGCQNPTKQKQALDKFAKVITKAKKNWQTPKQVLMQNPVL